MTFLDRWDQYETVRYQAPGEPPGRIGSVPREQMNEISDELMKGGCCAWVGRAACGASAKNVVLGQSGLLFFSYRTIWDAEAWLCMVAGCDRHCPSADGGENVLQTWTRDMPRGLRRSQEKELAKFRQMHDAGGA